MKMKHILPVFAVVLMLGLSNAAFAQLTCNVGSTPVSRATDTGLTEPSGDLIFNCSMPAGAPAATTAATMTLDYTLPITSTVAYPTLNAGAAGANGPIRIANTTGIFVGATAPTISAVNNGVGTIVLNVPAQPGVASAVGSFSVSGVLLALAKGRTAGVVANVSVSPGNNVLITAGQNNATVITQVLPGIKTPVLATGTVAGTVLASGQPPVVLTGGAFAISVVENYIDMFRSGGAVAAGNTSQFNGGANTQGVQLFYTFAGIPVGVTIGGCTIVMTQPAGSVGTVGVATLSAATITSVANTLTATVSLDANLTAAETMTLACTTWTQGATASLPFAPGQVTATVTLAPTGTAFSATGTPLVTAATGPVPRYAADPLPSPPLVVINIISATTHMLIPYVSVGNGYDTGIVIANTTSDPYGATAAAGGAQRQNGTVTVFFYPSSGTPFCLTSGGTATSPIGGGATATTCTALTSTAVGLGLSAGGLINTGNSWVVLVSELFKQITGAPAVFNGFAFAIANFTNAHATAFVADAKFSGKFASGGPALVLTNPQILARVGGAIVEGLGH